MKALAMCVMAGVLGVTPAVAGPVVREASGANAAAIQAAVDQFRADLGGANNGNVVGTQPGGRREINWDGGGAAANVTLDPIPMTRFSARGASFVTAGSGFEISGQPLPEFGELNATYPDRFAAFSSPRHLLAAEQQRDGRGVPRAGRHDDCRRRERLRRRLHRRRRRRVDAAAVLHPRRRAALRARRAGGHRRPDAVVPRRVVQRGELVGRVRIISGNVALGPNETAALDVVAMDDFIYAEPVTTAGLTLSPGSTTLFRTGGSTWWSGWPAGRPPSSRAGSSTTGPT